MGNENANGEPKKPFIEVEYESGRGGGDKTGEDYFTGMFEEASFSKCKSMYDAAPQETKDTVLKAFVIDEIFDDSADAKTWLTDHADEDELKIVQDKIIAIIEGEE